MISKKIKTFLKDNKIKAVDYAKTLELATAQGLNTKYIRESFTIQDIILLANMAECDVSLTDKDGNIITKFELYDLTDNEK